METAARDSTGPPFFLVVTGLKYRPAFLNHLCRTPMRGRRVNGLARRRTGDHISLQQEDVNL